MTFLTRGLAVALLLGAASATALVAHAAKEGNWGMSTEARERLHDGKLAGAKTALKLTAEQEKLWAPLESLARAQFKDRADKRADWQTKREARRAERDKAGDGKSSEPRVRPDMAERIARMSDRLSARAERMKALSAAFTPFYASLTDEQKEVLPAVMRELRLMGKGGKGKGGRWAHGGGRHGGDGWERGRRGGRERGPDRNDDRSETEAAPAEGSAEPGE